MSKTAFIFLAMLLLLPCLSFAQSGKVRGWITDKETGDPIPDVKISIESLERDAYNDQNGLYVFLAVPPGEYAVRAECAGYQKTIIPEVRVSANLTTTLDIQMDSTAIETEVEFVAGHPLMQRHATHTIRIQTREDIRNLPFRGFQNIIALNPGTVLQDGELHIRGGRSGEVAYLINGANATNPLFNDLNVSIIQEAIQEIQMHTGGFTAEYGGANSAIVNTILRTGGTRLTGTLDFRTDNFVKAGNRFLETTSQGYNNVVATLGGPIPFTSKKVRFFLAGQYNDARNRSALFIEPFEFHPTNANLPEWSLEGWNAGERAFYAPWLVEDGLAGRRDHRGEPFQNSEGDVIPLKFERNFLPNNDRHSYMGHGTLVFDASRSLRFLLTGSAGHTGQREGVDERYYPFSGRYGVSQWQEAGESFHSALNNYYSNDEAVSTCDRKFMSLQATHIINPTTFYDVRLSWSSRKYRNFDDRFGEAWWKYADAREWEKTGMDISQWQSVFRGPLRYSTILDFNFVPPNAPKNNYARNSQTSVGGSLDFTTQFTNNIELKAGGRFDAWTMRAWNINNIEGYMSYLYGSHAELWPEGKWFENNDNKRIQLSRVGNIHYFGWDYDGRTNMSHGPYGPRKPFFASAYLQSKFEYKHLILNIGLRWEHIDYDQPRPENLENPEYDATHEWIDVESLVGPDAFDYLLPRINLAFPVTDNTVFHAQYGRYAQTIRLDQIFQSVTSLRDIIPERRSIYGIQARFLVKPERTNMYELGVRHAVTPDFVLTMTAFYKEFRDQVRADAIYADGSGDLEIGTRYMGGLLNNDFGSSRGVELTLELRRKNRLAAYINYTLSDTRGTGSSMSSNNVIMTDMTIARFPSAVYPLNYNQTHRGSVMLDYRSPRGDGGRILEGLGCHLLMTFNSGHAFIRTAEPLYFGTSTPWSVGTRTTADNRFRNPVEPINSSTTPWNFNLDLTLDKLFTFGGFNVRLYMTVLNLLNTKNSINVYETTGKDDDDGWLRQPLAQWYIPIRGYEAFYRTINLMNGWAYNRATGTNFWDSPRRTRNLWGQPRQIRLGLMLEFK